MSDDAFAVTPSAAQAPQLNEAIYQALHAALSATSRGRWFLSEFARRNRNSESSKMLDAVARIEQAVATRPAVSAASGDLQIARNWVVQARADAVSALNDEDYQASIASAERGIRIIREIATSMRAVGNDPRICRILDEQLDTIETAQRSGKRPFTEVSAAFDRLLAQLDELLPAQPKPADSEARLAAVADLAVACATGEAKIDVKSETSADDISAAEAAEDDALLAMIAAEMGAPDGSTGREITEDQPEITGPLPEPVGQIEAPEPEIFPAAVKALQPAPPPAPVAAPEAISVPEAVPEPVIPPRPVPVPVAPPAAERETKSLGAALLAQGVLTDSLKPARDPFADLKRLTQAEKIALFT